MTLNGVIALIICVTSPNSIDSEADYVTVVEERPIMSAEYCLLLLAKTDPPCSAVSLRYLSYLLILPITSVFVKTVLYYGRYLSVHHPFLES